MNSGVSVQMLDRVLFFPVTPFDAAGAVDLDIFTTHLEQGLAAGPGGVFVACGTGEFHALEPVEYEALVRRAVEVTAGAVPVYAGTGGSLPLARQFSRAAQGAGANGLLMLPPYLVAAPPSGMVAYTREVAAASDLPVIVYSRGNAVFDPETAAEVATIPNVTGFKDGRGDLDLFGRIVLAVRGALNGSGKPFQFFNGMPTAEVTVPAYRGIGITLYSSAVFCFAPDISLAFFKAAATGDDVLIDRFLVDFFHPLVELRNKVPGYAVSLVKTAVRLRGLDVGTVRPPLVEPSPEHVVELERIIAAGLALTAAAVAA
jgi:5-dehydro-4-deoxyglucarate dehydratase